MKIINVRCLSGIWIAVLIFMVLMCSIGSAAVSDLVLDKTVLPGEYHIGDVIQYNLSVHNQHDECIYYVSKIWDEYPDGFVENFVIGDPIVLSPGDTKYLTPTHEYVVRSGDITDGYVINSLSAKFENNCGGKGTLQIEVWTPIIILPAIQLIKTAGDAADGEVYTTAPGDVLFTYNVINTGDTYLSDIDVTDDNGTPGDSGDDFVVGTIAGPLAPGALSTLTATIAISSDRTNIGTATGNPTDDTGADIPGQADVTDSDDAEVVMEVEIGCTLTQGYWKNHPDAWPVETLMLGDIVHIKAKLIELLKTPTKGDASVVLVHQLIAAKLNMENGADPSVVEDIIADADNWLVDNGDTLPYNIKTDTPEGAVAVDLAETLDDYNNGIIGPGHCDDDDPLPPLLWDNPWDDDYYISNEEISLAEWNWATGTPVGDHIITNTEISLLEYQWTSGDIS